MRELLLISNSLLILFCRGVASKNKRGDQNAIKAALIGNVVLTRYNNKTYKIDDMLFDSSPKSTFTNSRGETMTYIEYYKKQYNLDIKDHNQPLLLHKLKKKEMKHAVSIELF